MRVWTIVAGVAVALGLALAWAGGGLEALVQHSWQMQRALQESLAGAIRALKSNQPGAVLTLLALCFGYGLLHAVGPGHGKMLLGSYALSTRVSLGRLAGYALASSLGQAAVAVGLVYAGVLVFDWTRQQMTDMAEVSLAMVSHAMVGAIGAYLAWRGMRMLAAPPHHHHDHCDHGHAHAPSPARIARIGSWRDGALLTLGIAIRPCSGALLVLLLCWRIGNDAAGIAGAFAMGLGTALVTLVVALLGATMREGAWAASLDSLILQRLMGALGLGVGALLILASGLLLRGLW